jgi:hypothetical protein
VPIADIGGPVAKLLLYLPSTRGRLGPTAFVFDLLVRVRAPSGSEVQEGPHRSHVSENIDQPPKGIAYVEAPHVPIFIRGSIFDC